MPSTAHYIPLSQGLSQGGVSTSSPLRRFSRRQVLYILLSLLSLTFLLGLGGYTSSVHKRVSPARAKAWFKANVVGSAYYPSWLPQLNPSAAETMLKSLTTIPGSFGTYDKNENDNYRWITEAKLRQLTACLARGDCPENADKIVVLGGWHCQWALHDDYHGGEGVWCLGLYRSLERQGFTVLQGGDNDYDSWSQLDVGKAWLTAEYVYHLYRQFGDYIRIVLGEPGDEKHKGTLEQYQKTKERPDGIPAWKFFWNSYYPNGLSTHVGRAWVVTAEPRITQDHTVSISVEDGIAWIEDGEEPFHVHASEDATFTYLGYGMKPDISDTVVVPWDQRPNRVYLLAKYARYFQNGHQACIDLSYFERATTELRNEFPDFEFVGGFTDERNEEDRKKFDVPTSVRNLGKLNSTQFDHEFGHAKLLLGMGSPTLSPSPYRALARAVPFLNPHQKRTDGQPGFGFTQHDSLAPVPEPYVYNVEAFDYDAFVGAIRKALTTPIPPTRWRRMAHDVVDARLRDWVLHDWRGEAEQILNDRKAGIDTQHHDEVGDFVL